MKWDMEFIIYSLSAMEFYVSGVNCTAWDVVKIPFQFLENFGFEKGDT